MKTVMDELFEQSNFSKEEKDAFFRILGITKLSMDGEVKDTSSQINAIIEELYKK